MGVCPGHILESTKRIKIKLGTHTQMLMRGSAEDKNHTPILHFTSVLKKKIIKNIVFFVMSWCTGSVGLQVLL